MSVSVTSTAMKNCPDCEVTGRQMVRGRDQDGAPWADFTRENCRTCRGTGAVLADPLPCPFCGGAAQDCAGNNEVACTRCDAMIDAGDIVESHAAWNRRAPLWQPISTVLSHSSRRFLIHARDETGWWDCGEGYVETDGTTRWADGRWCGNATHWMPLPAAPVTPCMFADPASHRGHHARATDRTTKNGAG